MSDIDFYYIRTEKYTPKSYVVNFHTQIGSSPSKEWTVVYTREENDTSNRIANDVFSRVRKIIRPIRGQRGVSFEPKFPPFIGASSLQLAAPLRRHSTRKVFLEVFFSWKKWKTSRKLEWNSFVCFTVGEGEITRGITERDV